MSSLHFVVIWCFKLIGVHIPQSVSVGDTVPIHCIFDLQGSSLYSLKWHKNGREFFRLYRATSSSLPLTSPAPPTPPFHQPSQVAPGGGGKGGRRKNQKNKQHHISQQQHQMYQQQTQSTNSVQLFPMPGIDVDVSVNCNPPVSFLPLWAIHCHCQHLLAGDTAYSVLPPLSSLAALSGVNLSPYSHCLALSSFHLNLAGSQVSKWIPCPPKRNPCLFRQVHVRSLR